MEVDLGPLQVVSGALMAEHVKLHKAECRIEGTDIRELIKT